MIGRRRPIRRIGESRMPLPQDYAKGVVFIGRRRTGKPDQILGTGFLVSVTTPVMDHAYVATAAHLVDGSDDTFIRIRQTDGSVADLDVPDWVLHGKHDVAVAPIELDDDDDDVKVTGL